MKNKTQQKKETNTLQVICTGIYFLLLMSCQMENKERTLFEKLPSEKTNVFFNNEIIENDTHNILNFTNLYTGSGVGIGDFNNDTLPDIFFGGNMVSSRLYFNQGNLKFKDLTQFAGVETDRWIMGVAVVDINADGWQDIYLSVSGNATAEKRKNLLFINQKNNSFTEEAEKYGIADTSQCTHANFFDYDKDGDLDLFIAVNPTDYNLYNVNNIRKKKINGEAKSTDKLYRNNTIEQASAVDTHHTETSMFTDVSREAGILIEGYSLGLNVSDLNDDDWPDIYVTNDFLTNDILYINNQDGTFSNKAAEILKHTSFASMGIDVADINNDGHPEIYALDMFPEDNYRQKMIMPGSNVDRFNYALKTGYEPQYSRNTLQFNNGDGTFSEIGQLANVHKTDWSWSALLADYDNDGLRDLFVTNGFRRDLGDLDYINYNNSNAFGTPNTRKEKQLESIKKQPGAKIPNYIFKNKNGFSFSKKSSDWGFMDSTCSHGAAYADLDLDGDLDLIINNNSQPALIYENKSNQFTENHYLQIKLHGEKLNMQALGTKVWLFYGRKMQYAENTIYRGYESTVDGKLHFGLGKTNILDSLKIIWPNGMVDIHLNIAADTLLHFYLSDNSRTEKVTSPSTATRYFNVENPSKYNLRYSHKEDFQIDFKTQSLLPHQHSMSGPCMAVGDINGDGLEDLFVGGAAGFPSVFYLQNKGGSFTKNIFGKDKLCEDTGCLLFDADNDNDLDLYVVSGGVVFSTDKKIYQDRLYFNNGNGAFEINKKALPTITSSGSCIAACDFDEDGDLDLFIGGRVTTGEYPKIPESYLLKNDNGIFKNIASEKLAKIGMVTTAIWTDFDNDGNLDLMLAGEFMPITFFKNQSGTLSFSHIVTHSHGWWNSLSAGDFDKDGDIDYLAGNLGLNSNLKASKKEPVCLYANDYDNNGSIDPILCQYVDGVEYPIPSRDNLIQQIPSIKARFNNYKKYAEAAFSEIFKKQELNGVQTLNAYIFESCFIENSGDGNFTLRHLPTEMQFAPINKFLVDDFNMDGNLDALAIGNNYATEVAIGRYDAFTGALLLGDGKGNFKIERGATSGFLTDKDTRDILKINSVKKGALILVANNSDSLQIFTNCQTTHFHKNEMVENN
ncbi:MAG: VCBS repeat-containing protein [Bacteroidota bacterium]